MTDRLKGFVVVLNADIREDDAQPILDAIRQLRGVLTVQPIVAGIDDFIAEERAKQKFLDKFMEVMRG